MAEKDDSIIEDIADHNSGIALPGEDSPLSPGTPPEGHRIRVDAADLEKEKKETDEDFKQRKREYDMQPDPFSPTGRKKSKIYLYDFEVKCIGKNKVAPARINGVPAAGDAIREFMLLRGIKHASSYRFRAFPVADTKRDAGDAGYSSTHIPDEVRQHRVRENS